MKEIIAASLKKRIKKFILIFIQFFIGITFLLLGLYSVESFFQFQENIKKALPMETVHISEVLDDTNLEQVLEEGTDEYNDMRNKYEKNLNEIMTENPQLKFGLYEGISYNVNGKQWSFLMCDKGALEIFKIPDIGLLKPLREYRGQKVVPVLISHDLSDTFAKGKIYSFPGDVMEDFQSYQIKIVGILPEDTRLCQGGSTTLGDSIKIAENIILGPEVIPFGLEAYQTNLLCLAPDKFDIEAEFTERHWNVNIRKIDDDVAEYFEQEKYLMFGAIGLSAILLFLSIIGCIGTLLSMIFSRTEEFGIYFSLGMQKKHLTVLVLGEVGFVFFLSYIFALVAFAAILFGSMTEKAVFFPVYTMIVTFAIIFFCALFCVILPVRRLRRLKPVDLLHNRRE